MRRPRASTPATRPAGGDTATGSSTGPRGPRRRAYADGSSVLGGVVKQKTWTARKEDLKGDWYVVDATGVALGRLASSVARILKGKHKPTYTPHLNTGDHVIVVNAERVLVTGSKLDGKTYTRYSGYPSGLRSKTLRRAQAED